MRASVYGLVMVLTIAKCTWVFFVFKNSVSGLILLLLKEPVVSSSILVLILSVSVDYLFAVLMILTSVVLIIICGFIISLQINGRCISLLL